mgnify:CR=1 FL=1
MTLKEIIKDCLRRIDEDIMDFSNLDVKEQVIINKLKTSINYCYRKLARDKLCFHTKETIKLENNIFNTEYLINTFIKLKKVLDSEGNELIAKDIGDGEIRVETRDTNVTVYYYYQPSEVTGMSDEPTLPARADPLIFSYYASMDYLNMEGDNGERVKAQDQLGLFNDAWSNISVPVTCEKIFDNYGGGYDD